MKMEKDKKYNIILGLMIFFFIIIVAGCLAWGLGIIGVKSNDNTVFIADNTPINSTETTKIEKVETAITNVTKGTYYIQLSEEFKKENGNIYDNCYIKLSENNDIEAYVGNSIVFTGKYNVSNKDVLISKFRYSKSKYGNSAIDISITFKILDNSKIEVVSAPTFVTVDVFEPDENGNYVAAGEKKELYLIDVFATGRQYTL